MLTVRPCNGGPPSGGYWAGGLRRASWRWARLAALLAAGEPEPPLNAPPERATPPQARLNCWGGGGQGSWALARAGADTGGAYSSGCCGPWLGGGWLAFPWWAALCFALQILRAESHTGRRCQQRLKAKAAARRKRSKRAK